MSTSSINSDNTSLQKSSTLNDIDEKMNSTEEDEVIVHKFAGDNKETLAIPTTTDKSKIEPVTSNSLPKPAEENSNLHSEDKQTAVINKETFINSSIITKSKTFSKIPDIEHVDDISIKTNDSKRELLISTCDVRSSSVENAKTNLDLKIELPMIKSIPKTVASGDQTKPAESTITSTKINENKSISLEVSRSELKSELPMVNPIPKILPSSNQRKTTEFKMPPPKIIEIKTIVTEPKSVKLEPSPIIVKQDILKPIIRKRETPLTIINQPESTSTITIPDTNLTSLVRKRDVSIGKIETDVTKRAPREISPREEIRKTTSIEIQKATQEKSNVKGRIIPITFEGDKPNHSARPSVRKHDPAPTIQTTSQQTIEKAQRRREIPIEFIGKENIPKEDSNHLNPQQVAEVKFSIKTDRLPTERKRDQPVVSVIRKRDDPKLNAKRDISADELELERTKKQLKEFVERWNSEPESTQNLHNRQPVKVPDSQTKTNNVINAERARNKKDDPSNTFEIGPKEEFTHYIIDQPGVIAASNPHSMAKQLQQKLLDLNAKMTLDDSKSIMDPPSPSYKSPDGAQLRTRQRSVVKTNLDQSDPSGPSFKSRDGIQSRPRQRPVAINDSEQSGERSRKTSLLSNKLPPSRDVPVTSPLSPTDITMKMESVSIADPRDSSPVHRSRTAGRLRPTRDVPTKANKDGVVSIPIAYEVTKDPGNKSRSNTPTRRGRKLSREERVPSRAQSRAHSRESNHSSSGKTFRRPSRDVPLTSTQLERMGTLNIGNCDATQIVKRDFIWPDIIVVPRDEDIDFDNDDDSESAPPPVPITCKLELTTQSTDKFNVTDKSRKNSSKKIPEATISISSFQNTLTTNTISAAITVPSQSISSAVSIKAGPKTSPAASTTSNRSLSTQKSTTKNITNSQPLPDLKSDIKQNITNSSITETKSTQPKQVKINALEAAYVTENKLVAWIMDIGTPQKKTSLVGSTTDLVSHFEGREVSPNRLDRMTREKSPRIRDKSPMPNDRTRDRTNGAPRPPFGPQLSREKSFVNSNLSNMDETIIQTPWGTLRRSTSRNSINKSPSKTSINSSPTSTTLLRTASSDIPLIKLDNDDHENYIRRFNLKDTSDRHSTSNLDSSSSRSVSRSPSPRTFKPYNKSLTARNLSDSSSTKSQEDSFLSKSNNLIPKNNDSRSPSPTTTRPPTPSKLSSAINIRPENALSSNSSVKILEPRKDTRLSSFDKKLSKQMSLEVLDSDSSPSPSVDSNSSLNKCNTIPNSPINNYRTSNRPPTSDNKRNSYVDIPPAYDGERRKSKTLSNAPFQKKQFSFLLFSAHDRISQFEKKDDKKVTRTQKPITRSRTSTSYKDTSLPPESDAKSIKDDNKQQNTILPSVVSSKFPRMFPVPNLIQPNPNIPNLPSLVEKNRFKPFLPRNSLFGPIDDITEDTAIDNTKTNPIQLVPKTDVESPTNLQTILSPLNSPSTNKSFLGVQLKASAHIGFMRNRYLEKQNQETIRHVVPFCTASGISKISTNGNSSGGFDPTTHIQRRRIMSATSLAS